MNETVKIFFGLIGGLALFLYGMNSMSDALQKNRRRTHEKNTQLFDEESDYGRACRCSCYCCAAKQLCDHGYGDWLRQRWSDEPAAGDFLKAVIRGEDKNLKPVQVSR